MPYYIVLKKRFKSLWNGVALFFMFSSIIFDAEIGYSMGIPLSDFTIALIMWIFGGTVANILFGADKPKKKSVEQPIVQASHSNTAYTTQEPVFVKPAVLLCDGCGFSNEKEALYCVECGTSLKNGILSKNH